MVLIALLLWFQAPGWLWPVAHGVLRLIRHHQAMGLFLVVFAEELGVPLPVPGDVAVAFGGFLTTTGDIPYPFALLAVVGGSVTGSFCLYSLARRFGHPFLVRFGKYLGLHEERLVAAQGAFRRWGPWAIVLGRLVPGMRIVLSGFAGAFEVPRHLFVLSVTASGTIWAAIFLEIGRFLGRNSRQLFHLLPTQVFPLLIVAVVVAWGSWLAYEHHGRRRRPAKASSPTPSPSPATPIRGEGRAGSWDGDQCRRLREADQLQGKAEHRTAKM
ncbi:MAG TPA: DedA family protein [Candidatus Dormibacteraeota bacterium]|nr:DedA family protein [Candidatus Dormibacteraeota bacterium]